MTDDRVGPPFEADERATLTAFLDFHRATLAFKCDGLTDDQLRERAVPPSSLSLLGLVRHMAEMGAAASSAPQGGCLLRSAGRLPSPLRRDGCVLHSNGVVVATTSSGARRCGNDVVGA
jgi:hypothetical protein